MLVVDGEEGADDDDDDDDDDERGWRNNSTPLDRECVSMYNRDYVHTCTCTHTHTYQSMSCIYIYTHVPGLVVGGGSCWKGAL